MDVNFVCDLTLDGQDYSLKIDFQTLCLVERATGQPMLQNVETWASIRIMTAIIWAAIHRDTLSAWYATDLELRATQPTLDEVAGMIQRGDPMELFHSVLDAIRKALPSSEDGEESEGGGQGDPLPEKVPATPVPS